MALKSPTPLPTPTAIDLSILAEAIKTSGFVPVHQEYFLSRLNAVADEYQRISDRRQRAHAQQPVPTDEQKEQGA